MKLLSGYLAARRDKIYVEHADSVVRMLRTYGPKDLATMWAGVVVAKAHLALDHELDQDRCVFLVFDLLESIRRPTEAEEGRLRAYLSRVIHMTNECEASDNGVDQLVCRGLNVWIVSIRAIMRNAVVAHARETWKMIASGDQAYANEVIDEACKRLQGQPMEPVIQVVRQHPVPPVFHAQ